VLPTLMQENADRYHTCATQENHTARLRARTREMLMRTAGFPAHRILEAYDLAFATDVPRAQTQQFPSLGFVERAEDVALPGGLLAPV
jgi:DNA replication protein DnaC